MRVIFYQYAEIKFGSKLIQNVPTQIVEDSYSDRKTILLYNNTNKTIYIGVEDTELDDYFPLIQYSSIEITTRKNNILYGYVEGDPVKINFIEGR